MKRPIILIHGAWHGGSCFSQVAASLKDQGHSVHVPELPLCGFAGDVAAASNCIAANPGAVVLGHSYGGLVATHATNSLKVAHMVYLAALMPDKDEDIRATVGLYPSPALEKAWVWESDGRSSIDPDYAVDAFYHDCDSVTAEDAVSRLRSQVFDEQLPVIKDEPAWRSVPSTYVICLDDRAQNVELQRRFAENAGQVLEWPGSHSPFLSKPELVVNLLANIASKT